MKVAIQHHKIVEFFGSQELIEKIGRVCYKSEDKIKPGSAARFINMLKKDGHEAMIEFGGMVVKFVTNRGVSHEIVRHRLCSFAQESTRYCNYASDHVTYVLPVWQNYQCIEELMTKSNEEEVISMDTITLAMQHGVEGDMLKAVMWCKHMLQNEQAYYEEMKIWDAPEKARGVLNNDLKTEIFVYASHREWRHIFKLRSLGVTGRPHPQMKALIDPLRAEALRRFPAIYSEPQDAAGHTE